MRRVAGCLFAAAVAASTVVDSAARADTPPAEAAGGTPQVRALIEAGIARRKQEDDQGARDAFNEAWRISQAPEALAQLALSEQALGLWGEAHEHLTMALARAEDEWIRRHRAALDAALLEIESRLGRLEITCNVDGAAVRMDRRVVGQTPLAAPLYVLAGRSVVELSAEGYFEVTRQVQIDAGALSRLNVTLSTRAAAPQDAVTPRDAGGGGGVSSRLERDTNATDARDLLRYGSFGLAALGAAVGVSGYVMREINVDHYNDDSRCNLEQGRRRSEECPDAAAGWRLGEGLAIGGFAAAGVFGALGLYLSLTEPTVREVAITGCEIGVARLACSGRF